MTASLSGTSQVPATAATPGPSHSKGFQIVANLINMPYATLDPWGVLAWAMGDTAAGATPTVLSDLAHSASGGAAMWDSYALTGNYPVYSITARLLSNAVVGAAGRELWVAVFDGTFVGDATLTLVRSLGVIQA